MDGGASGSPLLFDGENRYAARAIDFKESFHVD